MLSRTETDSHKTEWELFARKGQLLTDVACPLVGHYQNGIVVNGSHYWLRWGADRNKTLAYETKVNTTKELQTIRMIIGAHDVWSTSPQTTFPYACRAADWWPQGQNLGSANPTHNPHSLKHSTTYNLLFLFVLLLLWSAVDWMFEEMIIVCLI